MPDHDDEINGFIGHNGGPPLDRGRDGWVALSRSIRDHWLVGFGQPVRPADPMRGSLSRGEAFIDLIMECRFEAGTVVNGGRKMEILPGQLVGAVSWLASRWNWTPKTVRGFLDKLSDDGMISMDVPGAESEGKQKGKQSTIITVCNYSDYQMVQAQQGQAKGRAEGKQGASKGQAKGNNTKDNTGTKEQEEDDDNALRATIVDVEILAPEPTPSRALVPVRKTGAVADIDPETLSRTLLAACNGALDNPVNCSGLLSMGEPIGWLNAGCDLHLDILPALKAIGHKMTGKRIRTWSYFTEEVYRLRDRRMSGPTRSPPRAKPIEPEENRFEKNRRKVQEALERQQGGRK